jgi:hypothetical protein
MHDIMPSAHNPGRHAATCFHHSLLLNILGRVTHVEVGFFGYYYKQVVVGLPNGTTYPGMELLPQLSPKSLALRRGEKSFRCSVALLLKFA